MSCLDLFFIDNLPLFALLYADDAVIFSKSSNGLQNMLDKFNKYCKRWNLKVNVEKTKVMIFEKGRKTIADIYFDDEKLELIESFKYLGLTFFKNGKWFSQKIISQYGNFASHKLKCLLQNVYLYVNEKIKLFDSLVSSVLNYASEVWGYDDCKDIEIVHNKFCRYLLGVKKSTNIAAMYGELGTMPVRVVRKLRMLKYWIRILENSNENPFVYKIYEMMYNDVIQGRYRVINNWAFQIKKILDELGFSDVWLNQKHIVPNFTLLKQRITDQYKQEWLTIVNDSSKLSYYRLYKNYLSLETEKYLYISNHRYRNALCKFRVSAHNLEIETGRYFRIAPQERICKCCTSNSIESEYHFLLVYPLYTDLRRKYLPRFYRSFINTNKFKCLICNDTERSYLNTGKFIYYAANRREEFLSNV